MLFNTAQFAVFFLVVYAVYVLLRDHLRSRWLLVTSLVFYSLWIPQYILLLLFDVAVNYVLMRAMVRSNRPHRYVAASVAVTLGLLAFFKYASFLSATIAPMTELLLGYTPPALHVLLPLGISFYSFQILALTIDVYRGDFEPPESLSRYLLFIAFFPQLIAGPILRGREFLPQLRAGGVITADRTRRGLWLIAAGLIKKVVFGDFLLAPFVNEVYAHPGVAAAPVHLLATYSFAFQIYFDFSGYTDMARGMACLLGFEIPLNFMEPYLSRNPAEFWRRWHMTLSRWLRDYLYIPLGGNRRGRARTYVNLMLTMLLGGLWHGAGWNFVIWGGLHGVMLAGHRRFAGRTHGVDESLHARDVLRIVVMFHATCALWVFFRASTFGDAVTILRTIFTGSYVVQWPILPAVVVMACAVLHVAERGLRLRFVQIRERLATAPLGAAIEGLGLGVIAGIVIAASGTGAEFIYFQF